MKTVSKDKGQKVQVIEPDEAEIVKEIFYKYVKENMSASGIARMLNNRGIKTKRNAIAWDPTTVKLILTNPTYIGKVRYSTWDENNYFETDGQHERIITDELFYLAQEKTKKMPQITRTKQPRESNYFCGVLICSMCGSKFTTHNHPTRVDKNGVKQYSCSYRCNKKQKYSYPDDVTCKCPDINHIRVEEAFNKHIKNIRSFSESDTLIDINDDERRLLEKIVTLENQINSLMSRKKAIMEQYVSEEISFDDYKDMLSVINNKYMTVENELQKSRADIPTVEDISCKSQEDIIINIKENWEHLDNKERMIFLQRFVKSIIISVEKEKQYSVAKIEKVEFNQYNETINNNVVNSEPNDVIKKLELKKL